ncbi:MAG TPA: carboxypeptidase regulatory-like domain-containing protein [Pirellulales bacterium]|nr:carboxypeptidase regulatory-like domain-containing protein [Pirellulales bacterium]
MTTILAQLPVERLGWVLVHSLWQFLTIALVVRLFERTFAGRKSASLRYAAGLCGLSAITVAPLLTWFLIPAAPPASAGAAAAVSVIERSDGPRVVPMELPVGVRSDPAAASLEAVEHPPARYSLADAWSAARATLALRLRPWLPMLVAGWLVGMSLCSLRPLAGWLTLRRLRTIGISAVSPVLAASTHRIAARLGVTQAVSVWRSTITKTPLVVGYLRPVLLIPVAMLAQLPLAELEAILAHELAHIRRHDFLVNLWQTALETVFYYHPAVWSLSHRLRAEREHCCDDLALSIVGDPVCYGRALLHAEELRGAESLLAFGAGGGSLRGRILRLFGQSSPPTVATGLLTGVLLPSVALAGLLMAFATGAPAVSTDKSNEAAADKPAAVEKDPQVVTSDEMPAAGIVRGVLVNAADGAPIAGAHVILNGRNKRDRTKSGANGRFQFENVPPDPLQYYIWAYSDNLVTSASEIEQAITADGSSAHFAPLRLEMREGKQVKFLVTSAVTGKPLECAKIEFRPPDRRETATSSVGTTLVQGLLSQNYDVRLTALGHAKQVLEVDLSQPQRLTELRIELAAGGILRGVAVDADGKPVAGALVHYFVNPSLGTYGDAPRTDAQGRFQNSFLPLRTPVRVSIEHDDFLRLDKQIVLSHESAESDVRVTLTSRPHGKVVRGAVKDAQENPVPGARVANYGDSVTIQREATTNAQGEFTLSDLLEGYTGYQIYVAAKGFAPERLDVQPGNADSPPFVNVTLRPGHSLRGRVLDESDRPLTEALVTPRSISYAGPNYGDSIHTDQEGRFAFDSLPADARLHVSAPGYPFSEPLELPLDGDEPVTITLDAPGVLRGRVIDAETGEPVRQFSVLAGGVNTTFNASDGKFVIRSLRRGKPVELTVLADGYERRFAEKTFPGKENELKELTVPLTPIDLNQRYALRVQLLDFAGKPAPGAQLRLIVSAGKPIGKIDAKFNWGLIKNGQLGDRVYCDQFLSGVSDAAGEFEFNGILPGKHLRLAYWGDGVPQGLSLDLPQSRAGGADFTAVTLPQPARVIGRIKHERFPNAGSIRLSLLDDISHEYKLHLAERNTRFEFGDLPPGEYQVTVGSKPVEASENGQARYTIKRLASQTIQLQAGETKEVSFNEPDADKKAPAKTEPAPAATPAAAARSLDIVIAEHVILWDGRIRTWDEVVTELREIRKTKGEPIHPHFHFTLGAYSAGKFETCKAKVWELYEELFQPAGMSYRSMSPKAAPRYDAIRKAEDLVSDPSTLRSGIVVENGQPEADVLVVLVPENGVWPLVLKADLTLRDPLDDIWTTTDENGRFTLPIPPANVPGDVGEPLRYSLAAFSPTGYRLAKMPAEDEGTKIINLQPLSRIELTPGEGKPQRIDLRLDGGLPDTSPGLTIYEIDLRDKTLALSLPPGRITVDRSFRHEDGSSRGYPAETVRLGPGDRRKVTLPNITEAEAKR